MWCIIYQQVAFRETCTWRVALFQDHSLGRGGLNEIRRCRIGHTRFTHSFRLQGDEPPEYIPYAIPLPVKHILLDCVDFVPVRQSYCTITYMRDLFDRITPNYIFDFLKEINRFHKLKHFCLLSDDKKQYLCEYLQF